MNFLKNILGRVLALWALLVFVITMLIFVIPMGLAGLWPEPKLSKIAYFFYSRWMGLFFILIGVRRVIKGRENFKPGQNYVVICNHRSLMDPPLSSPAIPTANRTIAKSEMAKIPIFGIVYKRGSVLVDRKSEESRRASYLKMKEVLALGLHMCIYPEGTRNKTKEPLQRFHDGAFRLAVDAGKPIIPALIFDTEKVLPRKTFFFWPTKVEMHFLPEIAVTGRTVQEVKKEAFETMSRYYLQHK
ncbi:MAG TPA: 1-acyl-sn-glycerol-3-phosphate acyltransferase [Flavisolibacter sp.]|jgi:1-acyl-sn-glycerol-3-phosphate acyltransferase|nr:1-acyl-sn-glycerol-3-phosphate acyltransferase [Flavisolibacter sp.]